MKIFGDDGFRSRFGERYMTRAFLTAFAHAVADRLRARRERRPVVIARDPRASGPRIERWVAGTLASRGVAVCALGVVPTPVLSFALRKRCGGLGIMITASHNP
ncbi:MAG: phosphoglucosamine mutase, partial [Deltaproteobacteria bacterium]|nr:phosphoglucosamine mutase [Deltaproteobacteria bacterium]